MTLTDPREALADQSNFIDYLIGLAGLGQLVHALADGDRRADSSGDADDFVNVLLGIASLGRPSGGWLNPHRLNIIGQPRHRNPPGRTRGGCDDRRTRQ